MDNPYLSIVVAARNDNYGGDFIQRFQNFINWNARLLEQYNVATEFIIVNWNPELENAALEEQIDFPDDLKNIRFRIIEVPEEVHETFNDATIRKPVPLYEFIAKNVGVQRAKGEYILCTNADILISDQVVASISKKQMNNTTFYRSIRCDVEGWQELEDNEERLDQETSNFFLYSGVVSVLKILPFSVNKTLCSLYDLIRKTFFSWTMILAFNKEEGSSRKVLMNYLFNASGDFLLMHKSNWLNGLHYKEDTRISTHVDSIQMVHCLANGLNEVVLEGFVYHQEHGRRFDFSKKDDEMDLMWAELLSTLKKYRTNQLKPLALNFGIEAALKETIIG